MIKKLKSICLGLVVAYSVVNLGGIVARAESSDRISTFINLASGKQTADLGIDSMSLSEKDLQFLGVYISNFFVPFGTELGTNSDITTINKEDIKKALQTNLNFNDSIASSLTETLLGLSRSSIKELVLCVSEDYQKDLVPVTSMPLNYYTVLTCMLGGLPTIAQWYGTDNTVITDIKNDVYTYGYFAYLKDGKYTPVFDFDIDMSNITPSASAFIKCLESNDIESGYGFNFFDFTKSEMGVKEGDYSDKVDSYTNNQMYKMSAYGSRLSVDCFGNLILMGGNHQFIAVPGAMNPYTWVTVDSKGSPVGEGLGGTAYNIINLPSMALQENSSRGENSNSLFSGVTSWDNNSSFIGSTESNTDQTIKVALSGDLGANGSWFKEIGSDEGYDKTTGIFGVNKLKTYLDEIINYAGGQKLHSSGFKTYVSNGTLYIEAKASALVTINYKKITNDYLNSSSANKGTANTIKKYKEKLLKDYKVSDNSLIENLKKISNEANSALLNSNNNGDISNSETGMVRQGILNTSVLVSKLRKVALDAGNGIYALRKVRGSSDSGLGSGILDIFTGSSFRELAKMAEEGFKEANPTAKNYYNGNKSGIVDGILSKTNEIGVYGVGLSGDELSASKKVDILDSVVFIDNLGAAHFDDSGQSVGFSTFNVEHYIGDDSTKSLRDTMASWGSSSDNGFTSTYGNIENGKMVISNSISKEAMVSIYITYACASLYDETNADSKKSTIGELGYKMNRDNLPSIPDNPLVLSSEAMSDIMLTSIRDWVYYLLHPTEGITYFVTWIKNKVTSFFLSWHDDMVGTNGTGSINGTTKYRGYTGYVTTPELTDIPFTDSMLNMYNNALPFILVFLLVIMLGAYVIGILGIQKAIMGFGLFVFCSLLPPVIINNVVGVSNRFSSSLYGEKFTYWALVQHESYASAIDEASSGKSYSNYLRTLYATNSMATGNQGSESIMLKWQAPKKMASLMLTSKEGGTSSLFGSSNLLGSLIDSTYSGESYIDDKSSVYLYRSYIDIANFSRYIHRGLSGSNPVQLVNLNITNDIKGNWYPSLRKMYESYESTYEADRALGYANKNGDGSSSGTGNSIIRVRLPLSSKIVSDAFGVTGSLKNMSLDDYVGIHQDAFNFSTPMFNVSSLDYYTELKTENFNPEKYTREDYSGLAAYGLMSENPFYYFSWYLYETGLSEESNTNIGYKNLLLGKDNAGFFYNAEGNGELKDFMDMRSLFTYIIPYLKQGNDIVEEWDNTYGIFIYDDVPSEEGHANDVGIVNNPEMRQKYWHNVNVARLYNIYTPWVDVMYDCSYAKPEKISYLGETYVVSDPISPSSYPEDRPMIFSKSEMVDYGLSESQLTNVERKILKVQEGMQKRLFKLLNYYNFSDTVLNTAAAMNCAFEFNTVFSENSLIGANNNIYPQSFELSNFSYDAFLRFILSNSTGDSMLVDKDGNFYENVVKNSNLTTVIVMLVLDIISMYVVPGLKLFFIVGVFILFILIVLVHVFKIEDNIKIFNRMLLSFLSPMLKFLAVTCGLAFIVSLFMGEGNTAVTGSMGVAISLGDPVMVMLVMVLLNSIVVFMYFKILLDIWRDIKSSGKKVFHFASGVTGALGGLALSSVFKNRKDTNSHNTSSGGMGNVSPNVQVSERAVIRGSRPIEGKEIKKRSKNIKDKRKYKDVKNEKSNSKFKNTKSDIDSKSRMGISKIFKRK